MVGWHHQLSGHESEQVPGDGEGQGSLACCSPWGHKELDITELLNNSEDQHLGSSQFKSIFFFEIILIYRKLTKQYRDSLRTLTPTSPAQRFLFLVSFDLRSHTGSDVFTT